jgi:anti-sigma factor RsiW
VTDIGGDFLLLRGYLAGDLPAEQMRAIEARLEQDPRLVRELELHLRMREGFELVQAERRRGIPVARRRQLRRFGSGLAAAAGCAGVALLLWSQRAPELPLLSATGGADPVIAAESPVAAQFTFVPMRGAERPDLALPAHGVIELRAAAGSVDGGANYRLSLVRQDSQGHSRTIGTLTGLRTAADGYLHSYLEAAHLAPGDYVLEVAPETQGSGTGETFAFRLRPPGH